MNQNQEIKIDHKYFDTFNNLDNHNLLIIITQISYSLFGGKEISVSKMIENVCDFSEKSVIEICQNLNKILDVSYSHKLN